LPNITTCKAFSAGEFGGYRDLIGATTLSLQQHALHQPQKKDPYRLNGKEQEPDRVNPASHVLDSDALAFHGINVDHHQRWLTEGVVPDEHAVEQRLNQG